MSATITVVCPKCKNRMSAMPEYVGRKGRCQVCDSLIDIRPAEGDASLMSIRPPKGAASSGPRKISNEAPAWLTGLAGILLTVLLYGAFFYPLSHTPVGTLFIKRGLIPIFSTFITCWGIAILAAQYLNTKRQLNFVRRELELIPLDIGLQITQRNADKFLQHLAQFPGNDQSILCRRIAGAIEHFKSRNSVPEVQQYLATQAEIDASAVDAGFTLLRSFIWANPILGFLGTVVGISIAVSGLSSSFSGDVAASAETGAKLVQALGGVTSGLSTAFDTTLIGLVFAMLLMFPTEALRKTEYQTLDRIEQFTNESLLRRLSDADGRPTDGLPDVVRAALEGAFQEHQRWLAEWQAQVAELGQAIGGDFESVVDRVLGKISETEQGRWSHFNESRQSLEGVFAAAEKSTELWHRSRDESAAQARSMLDAAAQLQAALADNIRQCEDLLRRQNDLCERLGRENGAVGIHALTEQLEQLTQRMTILNEPPEPRPITPWDPTASYHPQASEGDNASAPERDGGLFGRWLKRKS